MRHRNKIKQSKCRSDPRKSEHEQRLRRKRRLLKDNRYSSMSEEKDMMIHIIDFNKTIKGELEKQKWLLEQRSLPQQTKLDS